MGDSIVCDQIYLGKGCPVSVSPRWITVYKKNDNMQEFVLFHVRLSFYITRFKNITLYIFKMKTLLPFFLFPTHRLNLFYVFSFFSCKLDACLTDRDTTQTHKNLIVFVKYEFVKTGTEKQKQLFFQFNSFVTPFSTKLVSQTESHPQCLHIDPDRGNPCKRFQLLS